MPARGFLDRGGFVLADAVRNLYRQGHTDYSMDPIVVVDSQNQPISRIEDGDAVVFCCRRGEREIELTEAFVEPGFDRFPRKDFKDLKFVILTLYHEKFLGLPVAFSPSQISDTLGSVLSKAGLQQLRVAESEKFAHVTTFFNGGNPQPFQGEIDVRIPSPRGIPFDQVPELSLEKVADEVIDGIHQNYDLIVTNFANGDVIGHTQNNAAKLRCAEFVDQQLGRVVEAALAKDTVVLLTADHGNLEEMTLPDGSPHVAHTSNLVNFFLIDPRATRRLKLMDGVLADISPTLLHILGIPQPEAMTGTNLAPDYPFDRPRQVLLIILDGWGIGPDNADNPIYQAPTPVLDNLARHFPCSRLKASGEAVGLQPEKPGNSEAGHINMGAGRVILQDDVRLDNALQDGSFFTNPIFQQVISEVRHKNSRLHLIGLLTEKSSHGSIDYPLALAKMAKEAQLKEVYFHLILDGRSTEPGSAPILLEKLQQQLITIGVGKIASAVGRGLALDRDGNYAKVKKAYDGMVFGVGKQCAVS